MNGRLQSCLRMIGWGQTLEMHGDGEGLIGSADLPMIPLVAKSMPMPSSADVTPRERGSWVFFDQGLRKKMTFVCADEGFGKSTAPRGLASEAFRLGGVVGLVHRGSSRPRSGTVLDELRLRGDGGAWRRSLCRVEGCMGTLASRGGVDAVERSVR